METPNDLNFTPMLKELLTNYIIAKYQEDADTSDEYLWMEYAYMKKNNELGDLFQQEFLASPFHDQNGLG
jgi:hypothetical protein